MLSSAGSSLLPDPVVSPFFSDRVLGVFSLPLLGVSRNSLKEFGFANENRQMRDPDFFPTEIISQLACRGLVLKIDF